MYRAAKNINLKSNKDLHQFYRIIDKNPANSKSKEQKIHDALETKFLSPSAGRSGSTHTLLKFISDTKDSSKKNAVSAQDKKGHSENKLPVATDKTLTQEQIIDGTDLVGSQNFLKIESSSGSPDKQNDKNREGKGAIEKSDNIFNDENRNICNNSSAEKSEQKIQNQTRINLESEASVYERNYSVADISTGSLCNEITIVEYSPSPKQKTTKSRNDFSRVNRSWSTHDPVHSNLKVRGGRVDRSSDSRFPDLATYEEHNSSDMQDTPKNNNSSMRVVQQNERRNSWKGPKRTASIDKMRDLLSSGHYWEQSTNDASKDESSGNISKTQVSQNEPGLIQLKDDSFSKTSENAKLAHGTVDSKSGLRNINSEDSLPSATIANQIFSTRLNEPFFPITESIMEYQDVDEKPPSQRDDCMIDGQKPEQSIESNTGLNETAQPLSSADPQSIYAIGGFIESTEATVEKYNIKDDEWEVVSTIGSIRAKFVALRLSDEKILILGGMAVKNLLLLAVISCYY